MQGAKEMSPSRYLDPKALWELERRLKEKEFQTLCLELFPDPEPPVSALGLFPEFGEQLEALVAALTAEFRKKLKQSLYAFLIKASNKLENPQNSFHVGPLCLTGPLPKPKEFKPALVKVLGQMTNNTPRVHVRSEDAITLVLAELGVTSKNCPWPMRGKPSVRRNIGYAYRNSKEGYKNSNPLFAHSTDSGKWALNELGAKEAAKFNPGGSVPNGAMPAPPLRSTRPISPSNRTLWWLEEQGPKFIEDLKAFAAARFTGTDRLNKIDALVQVFLTELLVEDKIGNYYDRNRKWPTQTNVLGWWQRHSITMELRAGSKEAPLDFTGGDLENEMVKQLDSDAFLKTVVEKLNSVPDGDAYQQIMRGLSDSGARDQLLQELEIPDSTMEEVTKRLKAGIEGLQAEDRDLVLKVNSD